MGDESDMITMLSTTISNFGFPIAITGYLLLRFEKKIDSLTSMLYELKETLNIEGEIKK